MAYRGTINRPVQTGYFDQPFPGFVGQIATPFEPFVVNGYPVEETDGIGAGLGVVRGTAIDPAADQFYEQMAPWTVTLPTAASTADDFVGIAVREHSMGNDTDGNPIYYNETMAAILREGKIYTTANAAVIAGGLVYMYIQDTLTHGFPIGSFAAASTADTVTIANANYVRTANAGEITVIELRLRTP